MWWDEQNQPRAPTATEPRSHLPPLSVLVRHFITVVRNAVHGLGMFGLLWRVTRVWGLRHLKLIFLWSKLKAPGNVLSWSFPCAHIPRPLLLCPKICLLIRTPNWIRVDSKDLIACGVLSSNTANTTVWWSAGGQSFMKFQGCLSVSRAEK